MIPHHCATVCLFGSHSTWSFKRLNKHTPPKKKPPKKTQAIQCNGVRVSSRFRNDDETAGREERKTKEHGRCYARLHHCKSLNARPCQTEITPRGAKTASLLEIGYIHNTLHNSSNDQSTVPCTCRQGSGGRQSLQLRHGTTLCLGSWRTSCNRRPWYASSDTLPCW